MVPQVNNSSLRIIKYARNDRFLRTCSLLLAIHDPGGGGGPHAKGGNQRMNSKSSSKPVEERLLCKPATVGP